MAEEKFSSNESFLAEMDRRRQTQDAAQAVTAPQLDATAQSYASRINVPPESDKKGFIGFLLNHHIAKSEVQANAILIGIIVMMLAATAWVLWG